MRPAQRGPEPRQTVNNLLLDTNIVSYLIANTPARW